MKDYLKQFQFPDDLKEMDYDELELLSYEIRDFLIEKVQDRRASLSNLGAVERRSLFIAVSILRRTRSSGM